jgi:hypothetical protein
MILTTLHLLWWLVLIVIGLLRVNPLFGWGVRAVSIAEPALYAGGVTFLSVRWFRWRSRDA